MTGLYLYCVRGETRNPLPFHERGIDGRSEVFTVAHRALEAVVSDVSLREFTSEEIQRRAGEDPGWIKERAVIHERVIENAMRGVDEPVSVIPMRFGVIFKTMANLKARLDKDYCRMKTVLAKIDGKEEWSVKAYMKDKERFDAVARARNPGITAKERQIASLPEGVAYFMEEELKEVVDDAIENELAAILEGSFERLSGEATESVKTRVLEKEVTGRTEQMVFNSAFLVRQDKADRFHHTLGMIAGEFEAKGLCVELTGPWPAFNFCRENVATGEKREDESH